MGMQNGDQALQKKSWWSLITTLHTCVSIMLKCISMQNLIKTYNAVQELWAFSLKDLNWPKWCSAKPRHPFAYQWLDNIRINKYAKFAPNIPYGSIVTCVWEFLQTDPNRLDNCSANPCRSRKCEWRMNKWSLVLFCLDQVKLTDP